MMVLDLRCLSAGSRITKIVENHETVRAGVTKLLLWTEDALFTGVVFRKLHKALESFDASPNDSLGFSGERAHARQFIWGSPP